MTAFGTLAASNLFCEVFAKTQSLSWWGEKVVVEWQEGSAGEEACAVQRIA